MLEYWNHTRDNWILAYTCKAGAALPQLEYSHYTHRPSIWFVLFKLCEYIQSNTRHYLHSSNSLTSLSIYSLLLAYSMRIMRVLQTMQVYTCITCISYASNSKYLLALFEWFKLFELFIFDLNTCIDTMRVFNSHTLASTPIILNSHSAMRGLDSRGLKTIFFNIRSCLC